MEKENKTLEYKEMVSKNYLKTVSAYANYNDGVIIFGISDDYRVVGIANPEAISLDIENQINDSIKPKPNYTLKVNNDKTITLIVKQGNFTPYRYNGKAYKRNDTSTIEVDEIEEKRLILSGMNISFEEVACTEKNLSFTFLKDKIIEAMQLESFNLDTLKSLNLYNVSSGYNNAASLLADTNNFPGLDIAVFGNNINIFKKRITLSGESILKQYYDAINLFKDEYIVEEVIGGFRKTKELIPFEAFREAVANAIVHRTWDVYANTKIEMHSDRVFISSPGGLMPGMSKEDYLNGNYSYLRNAIVANVFRRLNIIEAFATGIRRINGSYQNSLSKPIYEVTSGSISITLPLLNICNLSSNEEKVLNEMKNNHSYSSPELRLLSGLGKDSLIRTLNSLLEKDLIVKEGKARATTYSKK